MHVGTDTALQAWHLAIGSSVCAQRLGECKTHEINGLAAVTVVERTKWHVGTEPD